MKATAATIAKLENDPDSIDDLSDKGHFLTYFSSTISYFTTGAAALCPALAGLVQLDCSTVVDGELGIVKPTAVARLRDALTKLDLDAIASKIDAPKPKPLAKLGVEDFDMLQQPLLDLGQSRGRFIASEIERLIAFYKRIAKAKAGIAMYTS